MQVLLRNLRLFAHHGVLPQEQAVGAYFMLNLAIDTDFSQAMNTDELTGTISYAEVFEVVKAEMSIPSKLLEHVACRICRALLSRFPAADAIHIEILKENPPIGADCTGAGIQMSMRRNDLIFPESH